MAPNILSAIQEIASYNRYSLLNYAAESAIRINAAGDRLEYYLRDAFARTFHLQGKDEKMRHYQSTGVFSYLANQNNPPDIILNGGDAFEIKKVESPRHPALALNSSPPKDRLYRDDRMITQACRDIEGGAWESKDIFYVVGNVDPAGQNLRYIMFAHGLCYAASPEVYGRILSSLKESFSASIGSYGLVASETNELGRINAVDPLGITSLRIRGMWQIQNPMRLFKGCKWELGDPFSLFAVMTKEKFFRYPENDIAAICSVGKFKVNEIQVTDPNNLARRIDAILIEYRQTE